MVINQEFVPQVEKEQKRRQYEGTWPSQKFRFASVSVTLYGEEKRETYVCSSRCMPKIVENIVGGARRGVGTVNQSGVKGGMKGRMPSRLTGSK